MYNIQICPCCSTVDRGADGVQVIFWYHRQFVEAAEARYCQGETSQKLHTALADFFGGTWANGKYCSSDRVKLAVSNPFHIEGTLLSYILEESIFNLSSVRLCSLIKIFLLEKAEQLAK